VKLGGIHLHLKTSNLEYLADHVQTGNRRTHDCLNSFLLAVLKHCWRVKRHPLVNEHDVPQDALRTYRLPVLPFVKQVIERIEQQDRRIG